MRTGCSPRRGATGMLAATMLTLLFAGCGASLASAQESSGRPAAREAASSLTPDLLRDFRFRLIGPANTSGRVTSIAVPATPHSRTIYLGFAGAGVWKSVNNGTTFSPIFDDHMSSIGDVAVAPSNDSIVWVGTGERQSLRSNAWGDGVYRSTNGGRTWTHLGLEQTRSIGRIVIHPTNPDIVYVAAMGHIWGVNSERGVFKTTDAGKTWNKVLFVDDTTGFVDLKMDPSNPEVLYAAGWQRLRWGGPYMLGAGAGSGIWKTTDGGTTWTRLTDPALENGLPHGPLGRIGLGLSRTMPGRIYAIIQATEGAWNSAVSTNGGLFRSDDGGASWTRLHDISANPDYYYNEVYVDPNDDRHLLLNSVVMAESKDGGETFTNWNLRNVHVDNHALWIDPEDSKHMLLGNDGGLHATFDAGAKWMHFTIPAGQFYEVTIDSSKTPYDVCGGLQDNGVWCGPSATHERTGITTRDWRAIYGGDGFYSGIAADSPQFRYAESQYGNIAWWDTRVNQYHPIQPESEDAGHFSGYPFRWDWNTPFIVSQHDPTVVYLGGNYLFRLGDRGRGGWDTLGDDMTRGNRSNPEPDSGHTAYRVIHSIAESPLDGNVLWVGSDDGLIHASTDGGQTWTDVTDHIPDAAPRHCWVSEIELSRVDTRTAYITYDCHRRDDYRPWVYRTTDGGATFTNITGNLPEDASSYVVREDPVDPRLLFVGNERGIWISKTGGNDWVRLKNNLPTVAVRDMDINPAERELVAGTFGRSIWVLDIGPLEELTDSVIAADAHLFDVKDVHAFNTVNTYASFADMMFVAENPPRGAQLTYYLKDDHPGEMRLTIRLQGSDSTIATVNGPGAKGIHTVSWDLMAERPRPRRLGDPQSPNELREVEAGTYTVTLKVGDRNFVETFGVIRE